MVEIDLDDIFLFEAVSQDGKISGLRLEVVADDILNIRKYTGQHAVNGKVAIDIEATIGENVIKIPRGDDVVKVRCYLGHSGHVATVLTDSNSVGSS